MTQPKASKRNELHDLGYKIFLDRYAQKDMTRETLAVGDIVIVVVNSQTGQREIGKVTAIDLPKVTVKLNDGEVVERDIENVDKPLETDPGQMMDRVAKGIAQVEKTQKLQKEWAEQFRWLLDGWKFVPGGRILAAAGTEQELTFYNCYVVPSPHDSRGGIMTTLTQMTEIMSRGGGVGMNISTLRPRQAYVKGVNGRSSGSVSWGGLYSFVTGLIEQGGCFGPDERIATDKGLIPTAELADRIDEGETFFAQTHKGLREITARFRNGIKPLYEITTSRGYKVRITEDHKVAVLMDGEITTMALKYLQEGDEILLLLSDDEGFNQTLKRDYSQSDSSVSTATKVAEITLDTVMHTEPDTITAIELIGDSEVYDFEVDDVHLLSGNGVYTSNSRRGALMLILNDWHPDIFDFINSKRQAGQITNANISVGVSDSLMEAVEKDADWDLVFPDTGDPDYDELWDGDLHTWIAAGRKVVHYKTVKARDLWNAIIESAWASAEPGVWFGERSNKLSNSWYFNPLIATNPCGEQSLGAWSVCNLGAINLANFYDKEKQDVDWGTLDKSVRIATRFLDNVIDTTPYFFDENYDMQMSERRVGLGTMGIAELMIACGVRYGSDESVAFIDKVYKAIAVAAYETSAELAKEKGTFPKFDAEKYLESGFMQQMPDNVRNEINKNGVRNVTLLTQAPTGTTGTMVNTSTGIEPFFSWVYYRKSRLGLHEEQVPVVAKYFADHPDEKDLPDYFVTAMDLAPEEHVKVQGAFQKWIDSAISKTSNVPNEYTVEQVSELYKLMYELGCKGGTIYRDGSRDEQVLMLKGDDRAESEMEEVKGKKEVKEEKQEQVTTPHRVYPRPGILNGTTVRFTTPFGKSYITMNSDEHGNPFEVFITVGKAGSDIQADAEALGRMISLQLRTTAPQNRYDMLKLIVEQMQDIGGARPMGFGPNRILSLPDAVARALETHYIEQEQPTQLGLPMNGGNHKAQEPEPEEAPVKTNGYSGADMCPDCGTISLIRTEGCKKCLTCGYSEC